MDQYSIDSGKTVDEILCSNDIGWLEYRNLINAGDQNYLENVLSWIGDNLTITNYTNEGDAIVTKIMCSNEVEKTLN